MDNLTTAKLDAHTLAVVQTQPAKVLPPKTYDYAFLQTQRVNIQAQKDRDNALRDAELAEVDFLISEADRLGIAAKPVPPVTQPPVK